MTRTTNTFLVFFILLLAFSCSTDAVEKQPLLLAGREAPLGVILLRIYEDSTFEFESRGIDRKGDIYPGHVLIKNDSLFFHYTDSIPRAGKTALHTPTTIVYIDGVYPERLEIKLNKLENK